MHDDITNMYIHVILARLFQFCIMILWSHLKWVGEFGLAMKQNQGYGLGSFFSFKEKMYKRRSDRTASRRQTAAANSRQTDPKGIYFVFSTMLLKFQTRILPLLIIRTQACCYLLLINAQTRLQQLRMRPQAFRVLHLFRILFSN